jgi:tripartite ATP-independent transporter DctM subunit
MEWWLLLIIIFSTVVLLFLLEVPVAFSFLFINIIGFYVFMGGTVGLNQLVLSLYVSVTSFVLLPVPLFILMGEVMFRSGVADNMMSALDKWLGRLPGRLGLLAVASGTIFATLSGSSMASAAMLGSVLVPEMEKRGYKHEMSIGPIMGAGGLAMMIPPSVLGVTLAAMGRFSVGDFLIAIIIPGLLMAFIKALYIVLRCWLQPHLAPAYEVSGVPSFADKISATVRYIVPLGSVVFLCVGLIYLGVASPSEAAALGSLMCFVLAFIYQGFRWNIIKVCVMQTVRISVMLLMIITGAAAFSQLLAFTGASQGLVELAQEIAVSPMAIMIVMLIILLILGCFMESMTIIMITIPIFMPIIRAVGIDPLWFGVIMLISLEMGATTPPFGMILYVMKGVAPHVRMDSIIKAGLPFLVCDLTVIILIMLIPALVVWLPSLMH